MITLTIPISKDKVATMTVPRPLSENEWILLLRILHSMKPGLVVKP